MNYEFQPTCQVPPERLDEIYTHAFGVKSDGVLVEVGAHDGWHWSCTWGLAKAGWNSVYVEPVKELFDECQKTHASHQNVRVVNCAVGPVNGMVTLGMGPYGASVCSTEKPFEIAQHTLDALLDSLNIPPVFDLLIVDVEGGEEGVLSGFTIERWLPKLVIIERPPNPNKFTNGGYSLVHSDWINNIYERLS